MTLKLGTLAESFAPLTTRQGEASESFAKTMDNTNGTRSAFMDDTSTASFLGTETKPGAITISPAGDRPFIDGAELAGIRVIEQDQDIDLYTGPPAGEKALIDKSSFTPYAGDDYALRTEGMSPETPIKTIYLTTKSYDGDPDLDLKEVVGELQQIGLRRGFFVSTETAATSDRWAEDNAIMFSNKRGYSSLLVSTADPKAFRDARATISNMASGFKIGDVSSLGRAFSSGLSQRVGAKAAESGWDVRSTPLAIEGGNLITTATKTGEPAALIGRNTLLVNWQMLKEDNLLPPNEVQQTLNDGSYDKELAVELDALSVERGAPIGMEEASQQAAEIEVARRMIATTLKLKPANLISVEQHGFHIDMETRPLDNGVIMVSDLDQSLANLNTMIEELEANPDTDPDELKELIGLRDRTEFTIVLGGQKTLDKKAETLEEAGFDVIRQATNYGGIGSRGRPWQAGSTDVNFANGIVATDRNGKRYMITNKSSSEALNERFEKDMTARGIGVEWVSTSPLLYVLGGIDCITLHKQNK